MVYGFGRRLATWVQVALAWQVRVPGVRRLFAEQRIEEPPVCGWVHWCQIEENARRRNRLAWLSWVHFRSQWGKERSSMLGLDEDGAPRVFVVVEPQNRKNLTSDYRQLVRFESPPVSIPSVTTAGRYAVYEPLPRLHRPARWDASRIRRVSEEASEALEQLLPRAEGIPSHWRPMHGDFVPWNLREDSLGQLWLLDWEDAGWGPPFADFVRYVVAYHSLGWTRPASIADIVAQTVGLASLPALHGGGLLTGRHIRNIDPVESGESVSRRRARDTARAAREVAAFREIWARRPGSDIQSDIAVRPY
jgi:hypothetical protein